MGSVTAKVQEATSAVSGGINNATGINGAGDLAVGAFPLIGEALGALTGYDAAKAKEKMAQAELEQQRSDRQAALAAADNPHEIAQLEQSVRMNERDLARREQLIASADPALIEAGKQALALLQGKEAATLGVVRKQREQQKTQLQNTLRQRLGTGFETSTAGIQAMAAFDQQTDSLIAQEQDRTLGRLLGVTQDTAGRYGTQENVRSAAGLAGQYGNIANRRISAITGQPINAGLQYAGDLYQAQANQQLFKDVLSTGAAIASGGASMGATGVPFTGGNSGGNVTVNQGGYGQTTGRLGANTDFGF